jgi:ABC-type sugar transport system ATPase subunit
LIDGALRRDGAEWRFEAPGLAIEARRLGKDVAEGPATIGLRPEAITVGHGAIPAEIQLVEQTGHENIVFLIIGDARLTARTAPHQVWSPGDEVMISIDTGMTHFFAPGDDGARLNTPLPDRAAPPPTFESNLREVSK